nr:unnamed protein product [Callosobruchus chinensis]
MHVEHRSTTRNLTDEAIKQFKDKLSVFDVSVGFSWLLSEEIDQDENNGDLKIVSIEDVLFYEDYVSSENKPKYFEDQLKVEEQYITQMPDLLVAWFCLKV